MFAILLIMIIVDEDSMKWTEEVQETQVEKQQGKASNLSHFRDTHCLLRARHAATCLFHICNPPPKSGHVLCPAFTFTMPPLAGVGARTPHLCCVCVDIILGQERGTGTRS